MLFSLDINFQKLYKYIEEDLYMISIANDKPTNLLKMTLFSELFWRILPTTHHISGVCPKSIVFFIWRFWKFIIRVNWIKIKLHIEIWKTNSTQKFYQQVKTNNFCNSRKLNNVVSMYGGEIRIIPFYLFFLS